ncbi:hypothetical protein D3C84_1190240 [compost metagenome]
MGNKHWAIEFLCNSRLVRRTKIFAPRQVESFLVQQLDCLVIRNARERNLHLLQL